MSGRDFLSQPLEGVRPAFEGRVLGDAQAPTDLREGQTFLVVPGDDLPILRGQAAERVLQGLEALGPSGLLTWADRVGDEVVLRPLTVECIVQRDFATKLAFLGAAVAAKAVLEVVSQDLPEPRQELDDRGTAERR